MSRWVVVDDTDPGITYTGPWFPDQGSQNSLGNFGPPYLSTLHGTNSDASFSYPFNGTKVIITGTNQFTDSSGVTNPSWQCIVDGVSVSSATVSVPENRLLLCEKDGLSDGPHVITVNVTVSNQQTFWFDYIQYLPSPSMSLAQVSLSIDTDDSQLHYGTGWSPISPGNMTGQTGSTFSFEFNGISLIWLGFYLNSLPTASTTATYAVDGQSPITFSLNGASSEGTGVQYNQIFFQTAQLSSGSHNLDVVYQGNSTTTPLTLSVLLVQNNESSSSSSFTTPTSSSASSLTQSANSSPAWSSSSSAISGTSNTSFNTANGSRNVGSIIGGVIGGVGLLTFAILAILFLRQRNNRSTKPHVIAEPFVGSSLSSPLGQHSPSNNFLLHSQQHASQAPSNADTTSLSLPTLTPNRGFSHSSMIQVNNATSLLTHGLREQRKGEEFISRTPQRRQETPTVSASSVTGNNFQPTSLQVREEDAGIRFGETDQDGHFVELLPPVYSS